MSASMYKGVKIVQMIMIQFNIKPNCFLCV